MKTDPNEYLPGPADGNGKPERRRLLADLRGRAWQALRERRISRGAMAYLSYLIEWAKLHGDGDRFRLGYRWQREETGWARNTLAAYRCQLLRAGLIEWNKRWAFKRGWFYEAETALCFNGASGSISEPESGSKSEPESGSIMKPYLIRKSIVAQTRLCPSGVDLPKGKVESRGLEGAREDRLNPKGQAGATKTALNERNGGHLAYRRTMGRVRTALGMEFTNDAGKWGNRAKASRAGLDLVNRVFADLEHCQRTGKPIKRSAAAYAEDLWKRWA